MPEAPLTPVVVHDIVGETTKVVVVRLRHPRGNAMPAFEPGAHVELAVPNGMKRQYSICSDPSDLSFYEIAVLREPNSRGASAYIHDALDIDDTMLMSAPRCSFPIVPDAGHHTLVAGGIGITPFLPMISHFVRMGSSFELHYLARSEEEAAFLPKLQELCGARLTTYFSGSGDRFDATGFVCTVANNAAQVYCCGPKSLMDDIRTSASGQPKLRPRFESFVAAPQSISFGDAFEVEIASTGQVLPVNDHETLLNALRGANCDVAWSCEHGTCGTCVVGYKTGDVVHRDGVLNPELRQNHLALCVSRARGRLVLDM